VARFSEVATRVELCLFDSAGNQHAVDLPERTGFVWHGYVPGIEPRYYMDYTGTGNSLNMRNPYVLQLLMDSLRYWIQEMHVDGFRSDLAATLARGLHEVDRLSAFFDLIQQDPVVSRVKLIAEPWDVGEGGYQVGNFPPRLHAARSGLRQREAQRGQRRGQQGRQERQPLLELRRGGRDAGTPGAARAAAEEFPRHPAALAGRADAAGRRLHRPHPARQQQRLLPGQRDLLVLLGARRRGLLEFTRSLIRLRGDHRIFHRRGWFLGRPIHGTDVKDLAWLTPEAKEMSEEDWQAGFAKSLGVFFNGGAIARPGERGERGEDDNFYVVFNAHHEAVPFKLPPQQFGLRWIRVLDTSVDVAPELRRSIFAEVVKPEKRSR
jgi:pullulanase/glycogen debranching enzyme